VLSSGTQIQNKRGIYMLKDWFSIVTAVVAIIAIIQTQQQIKLSNKQHLFDKRLEIYLIAEGLIQLFRSNSALIEKSLKDELILAVDYLFFLMTNNAYLEQSTVVIDNTLKEPYHKGFLIKLEDIKDNATKIRLLLSGNTADVLGDFVFCYQELLYAMYQYQIYLDKMKEACKEIKSASMDTQFKAGEREMRIKLQSTFDNLTQAYSKLKEKNVYEQIKKQIKLY
jgi:hypothetical protein